MSAWQTRGLCYQTKHPERWDTNNIPEGREADYARALCSGCTVIQECAADAVKPFDMTVLLGTFESPDIIQTSGVIRAGVAT